MRLRARLLIVLTILGFIAPVHEAVAQPLECGADDRACLEESNVLACSPTGSRESPAESCLAWIQQVQEHPLAHQPEWRLIAGLGYLQLALNLASEDDAERYSELSRTVLSDVIALWPGTNYAAQAYIGLATLATVAGENEASISHMRDALQADPDSWYIAYALAQRLERRSHATGRSDDYREAAEMYGRAYSIADRFWYLAVNALRLHALAGDADEMAQFRAQVAADSGMAEFADEFVSADFAHDLVRADTVLETACHSYIVPIFGPETCASGIENLVAATRATDSQLQRRAIVDVAAEAMRRLTVAQGLSEEVRSQFSEEFGQILREWINSGAATAAAYVLWAQLPESGLDESVIAFERALELEPDNGQYRYWLSSLYMAQGRFDDAIDNLLIARDTLPDNVGISPESVDARIRQIESERDRRR